ncbi:uncharacterized protein [Haliotis cracherodii]|uniref:uncharacterized protein n=1 Tax=Haliotis cracherodii TaxID=6455 RepID=UPI0039E7B42F
MAAFSTSFQTVLENNIRHMYSYTGKRPVHHHHYVHLPRVRLPTPNRKRYPRRFYDFYPEMNIGIPRAPAFREVDQKGMDDIVARLQTRITCQSESARRRCREKLGTDRTTTVTKKKSAEEIDDITKRLQRGTKCSKQRHGQRAEANLRLPRINLRNSTGQRGWVM